MEVDNYGSPASRSSAGSASLRRGLRAQGTVVVVWLLGFVMRSADTGGRKGRWYRW
jgi:hypothetical protein